MADDADSFFFSDRLGNNEHGVFAIVFRSDASRETVGLSRMPISP